MCVCVCVCVCVCLSICLSVFLSVCLSVCLFSCCLSFCLSVCLPVYVSVCLSVYLSVYLSMYLSMYLYVYLSVCLSICLSVYLSICLSVYQKHNYLFLYCQLIDSLCYLFPAITNIGNNPTFGNVKKTIETFIFDFDESIYGASFTLAWVARIRGEMKFASPDLLVAQIHQDIQKAKNRLHV